VPPNAGYLKGRDTIEKHFVVEAPSVTESSKVEFSNYRFDFLTPNFAFVDADLTFNNIMGPDQKLIPVILVKVVFVAERRQGKWWIRSERAHFVS
jgi:hypothetical protein